MFCKYCGKTIDEDSLFCRFCGKAQNQVKTEKPTAEIDSKVFNFGGMSHNEGNIAQINKWFAAQEIVIKAVSANAFMNINNPFKWETVINRAEFKYTAKAGAKHYTMGYFTSKKWIGSSYEKVTAAFEKWKKENPDKTVVWDQCMSHQTDGGSTQSLYFIYC